MGESLNSSHPQALLLVVARIAEIRFEVTARAILPWLIALLVVLAAITLWPPLTLVLAAAMRGGLSGR